MSVYTVILKIEKSVAYAMSCTMYKLCNDKITSWKASTGCFMHADYIEILNGQMCDLCSSRSILLHSFMCEICVPRRIKTLV
jgi:hypothetical protein